MTEAASLKALNPPAAVGATEAPLRFGILGAANIAPIALVWPIRNHPDAVVVAVAARDQAKADAFAKKHGIAKAYGGSNAYQRTSTFLPSHPYAMPPS